MLIHNDYNIQEIFDTQQDIHLEFPELMNDESIWSFINDKIPTHKGKVFIRLFNFSKPIWFNIDFLKQIPNLEHITIGESEGLNDYSVLCNLPNLKSISISNQKKTKINLDFIANLKKIDFLNLGVNIKSTRFLSQVKALETLSFWSNHLDFSTIADLKLKDLALYRGTYENWELLPKINTLKSLEMYSIKGLKNIDFISEMENMVELHLNNINELSSLPSFTKCKALKTLYFDKMKSIQDFSPIKDCQNLEEFMFYDNFHLKPEKFKFLQEMKQLKIALLSFPSDKQHDIYAKMMHEVFEEGSIILSNSEFGRYRDSLNS